MALNDMQSQRYIMKVVSMMTDGLNSRVPLALYI